MLTEELQIYRDAYELAKRTFSYAGNVPKTVRYGEYGRVMGMVCEVMDLVYVANSDFEERPAALRRTLQLLGGIRSRVRLFGELRYLSPRESVAMMKGIEKIGRQATGWRNTSQGQSRGATAKREYRSPMR